MWTGWKNKKVCQPGGIWARKRTQVLDQQLPRGCDVGIAGDGRLAVLERLLGARVEEADAVVVREARLTRDVGLDHLDGRVGRQLNGRRQLLDRLLRSCGRVSYV